MMPIGGRSHDIPHEQIAHCHCICTNTTNAFVGAGLITDSAWSMGTELTAQTLQTERTSYFFLNRPS
jgi:hypothetical protein